MQEFIEKEFYIEPPSSDATPEVWEKWMVAEKRKRAAHKRAYTMAQDHQEVPEHMRESTQRKVNGVWKQTVCLGISGEEGDYTFEPSEDAKQEGNVVCLDMERKRNKRGGSKKGKSARRRANRKARKAKK